MARMVALMIVLLLSSRAEAQLSNSDSNCGALGYACLNGRTCQSQRCEPAWQEVSLEGAPSGAIGSSVGAVDGEIVVVGGCEAGAEEGDPPISGGGAYDPSTDSWSALDAPETDRQFAASASSGTDVYLFGGLTRCYLPTELPTELEVMASPGGSWAEDAASGAPSPRYNSAMTWTGSGLFVFGGSTDSVPALDDGGTWTPSGGWTSVSCTLADCERAGHDAWAQDLGGLLGVGVRIWGGSEAYGDAPDAITYSLLLGTWSDTWNTPSGGPDFDDDLCSPAAGGDGDGTRRIFYLGLNEGVWIFDRLTSGWSFDPDDWLGSLSPCASAAWLGGELFAWSGDGEQYGGRYQPPAP